MENQEKTIIHIGMHKTGTTWFQNEFYPKVTDYVFINPKKIVKCLVNPNPFFFDPAVARKRLNISKKKSILCEEELSGSIMTGGLNGFLTYEMVHRLNATFPNATIVIFLRNQFDMVASIYRQYVKAGGNYSLNSFLYRRDYPDYRGPLFSFNHLDYYNLVTHYQKFFSTVKVFLFEDFKKEPFSFASQFSKEL